MVMATNNPLSVDRILKVGSKIFVYAPGSLGRERKLSCQLVGWQEGQFLLLTQPQEGTAAAQLASGEKVVLRYVLGGEVFGLRTQVIRLQYQPVPLLFVTFPNEIENVPLRAATRVSVRLPTVVSWLPSDLPPSGVDVGVLRDVTPDGALLHVTLAEAKALKGRSLHVTFALAMDEEIRVNAQVHNHVRSGENHKLGIGFNWSNPEDQEKLRIFCKLH